MLELDFDAILAENENVPFELWILQMEQELSSSRLPNVLQQEPSLVQLEQIQQHVATSGSLFHDVSTHLISETSNTELLNNCYSYMQELDPILETITSDVLSSNLTSKSRVRSGTATSSNLPSFIARVDAQLQDSLSELVNNIFHQSELDTTNHNVHSTQSFSMEESLLDTHQSTLLFQNNVPFQVPGSFDARNFPFPSLDSYYGTALPEKDFMNQPTRFRIVNPSTPQHKNSQEQSDALCGEKFIYDLTEFHSTALVGYNIHSNEKIEVRNLRVLKEPRTQVWDQLPPLIQIASLSTFRVRNNFTIGDCIHDQASEVVNAQYFEDSISEPFGGHLYMPKIRRTYDILENGELKTITEGLCPYCPYIKFGQMKNSNYGHHLSIQHGIQTDGTAVPDPLGHFFYYYEKKNKINWTNSIFEGVRCPVENCYTVCKLSPQNSENPNRLLDYLRHYRRYHKTGKFKKTAVTGAGLSGHYAGHSSGSI